MKRIRLALVVLLGIASARAQAPIPELTTAEKTEAQLEQYMTEHGIHKTWPAFERVLVGFDARPHSRQVIRDAWRLAHGLDADLIALHIEPEGYLAFMRNVITFLRYGSISFYRRAGAIPCFTR